MTQLEKALCKDFGTLKEFIRYVNKKGLINEDNQEYVTLARQQMDNIRTAFKRVAGVKTYSKAVESITDESNIDIVTEVNLKHTLMTKLVMHMKHYQNL